MTSLIPATGTTPWDTAFLTLWEVAHNDDGTQKTTGTAKQLATFGQAGTLGTGTGVTRYIFPMTATITSVTLSCNTAPTGASIKVDVNKNGTTIFTTQANRPTIATSGFSSSAAVPDVTSISVGDYLTCDIDQVGSTIAGADLVIQVLYTA